MFDFSAKQRIFSRGQDIEFRYIFSKYTADLGSFLIPNTDPAYLYPATSDNYLIGNNLQLKYTFNSIKPTVDDEINPIGTQMELTYNYEMNKFNPDGNYKVDNGILTPIYNNYDFHRLELFSKFHFPLWDKHTLTAKLRLGNIFGPTVPDFFDFYLGGIVGMRAYPFYAISGNRVGWFNLTYRFPLFTNIDTQIGQIYLDKIFMSFNGEIGDAWNGVLANAKLKKGAGVEIRIHMDSYYAFPTDLFFNASYGFDRFSEVFRDKTVTYGKEWRFYGGLLFGFDI